MKTNKQPILNYSIVQNTPDNDPSTLKMTKMELEVSPYTPAGASTNDLNTLCYLCETNGNNLPPAVTFSWNWVEQSEESSFDGVISINRNTFAKYFEAQLASYVSQNCFNAWVRVSLSGVFDQNIHYYWSMTPNQTPTITTLATGATVLNYSYSSSADDTAGAGGDMGEMKLSTTYTASVTFAGATIVITQNLVVYCYVRSLQTYEGWNVINKTITDTYKLTLDGKGGLTSSLVSVPDDNSDPTPSTNWFTEIFTDLNDLVNDVASWASGFFASNFHSMPLNVAQQFIFPGGKTFTFKDVGFSDSQDLVSHISYVQPNQ